MLEVIDTLPVDHLAAELHPARMPIHQVRGSMRGGGWGFEGRLAAGVLRAGSPLALVGPGMSWVGDEVPDMMIMMVMTNPNPMYPPSPR